ncbi:MAG: hypothetical protein LWW94_09700 [Candidatus Desulfofervidaceae bacterium]|nr:hypothetical protein [Candidatus Desulfofervidaceae bacterium]
MVECPYCGKKVKNKGALAFHIKWKHPEPSLMIPPAHFGVGRDRQEEWEARRLKEFLSLHPRYQLTFLQSRRMFRKNPI